MRHASLSCDSFTGFTVGLYALRSINTTERINGGACLIETENTFSKSIIVLVLFMFVDCIAAVNALAVRSSIKRLFHRLL